MNEMRISLLHPSRGRPQQAYETAKKWIEKAGQKIEYILSLDESDIYQKAYFEKYGFVGSDWPDRLGIHKTVTGFNCVLQKNTSVVEATNQAAKQSTGDILLYLSDDFDCPDNWANLIIEKVKDFGDTWLLKVDDCLQPFNVPVLTIPIMSRGLYNKLGYFWYSEYKSMFVDCDLYEVTKRMGVLKLAPELKFPHNHVSIGKAQDDETYRRSAANWAQGEELFKKRKAINFGL